MVAYGFGKPSQPAPCAATPASVDRPLLGAMPNFGEFSAITTRNLFKLLHILRAADELNHARSDRRRRCFGVARIPPAGGKRRAEALVRVRSTGQREPEARFRQRRR